MMEKGRNKGFKENWIFLAGGKERSFELIGIEDERVQLCQSQAA
jgi:hypothetical protein